MKCVAVLAVLPFFVATAFVQDGEPAGVKRFKKTVTDQAASILLLAHPLFVSGKSTEFDGYKKVGDVHEINWTIAWVNSKKIDYATTFAFSFKLDEADQLRELKIAIAKDTCPTKAFKGSNVAIGPLRIKVKNKVRAYVDDEELLKSIDRISTVQGLLEVWLVYANRIPKKN
jgi:hypothetical protein